ncbi:MAG: DUF2279 domain-containing protein, partial [Flavobacteriales bacterium]
MPLGTSAKHRVRCISDQGIICAHLRNLRIKAFAFIFLCGSVLPAKAQTPAEADSINPARAWLVAGGTAVFATGSLIALNEAWYKGYERTDFHFFNDGDEWLQMDKLGHAFSSYQVGRAGHAAFRWAGFNESVSTWIGGSVGLLYLSGIEYLDGHSSAYGFSGWDMAANTA